MHIHLKRKRLFSLLLCLSLLIGILPTTALAADSGVTLTGIELLEPFTNVVQEAIPTGTAKVRVHVDGMPIGSNGIAMLAGYDKDGRMVMLEVMGGRCYNPDGTCYFELEKVDIPKEVHRIKAMPVNAFGSFVPLCTPMEISNDGVTNRPVLPIVPKLKISTDGNTAIITILGDFDPYDYNSYIDISVWGDSGEVYWGQVGFSGLDAEGRPTYAYTNPYTEDTSFLVRLYSGGNFIVSDGFSLAGTGGIITPPEVELPAAEGLAYYDGEEIVVDDGGKYLPVYIDGEKYELAWEDGLIVENVNTEVNEKLPQGAYHFMLDADTAQLTYLSLFTGETSAEVVTSVGDGYFETANSIRYLSDNLAIYDMTEEGMIIDQLQKGDTVVFAYFNEMVVDHIWVLSHKSITIDPEVPVDLEMEIAPKGSTASITVTGEMDTEDYIAVYAQQNGTFTYAGKAAWDVQGDNIHSFSFENPYDYDCTFLFQLMIDNATAAEQLVSLAASAVSTVPKFENITVDGNTATITVVGDLDVNNDSIRAYTWEEIKYSFLGFAELVSSEDDVHTFTFANTTGSDCDIQFRLTLGGAEEGTWTVFVPAAGETVPESVAAPKGILSMEQTGMSLKIGMEVPDSMDNIDYFKLGFYNSNDREGTLQTGITCSVDHPYFYAPMEKFVVGTSYDQIEITAVGKNGYADATWTGDVSIVHLNPGFSATYTYDVGGENQPPLLSVDLEYSALGFYHIGVYENGKLLANDEAYQYLESGKVLSRSTTAEEDAAIRNGTAEVRLYGWNIAQLYEADGIWHMQMSIYSDTTAECMGIITPEDTDTPETPEVPETPEAPEVDLSTALLPTDIHLEYDPNAGLRIVMTKPADTSLIDGNIIWDYTFSNGSTQKRSLLPTVQSTSLLTDYGYLSTGANTIDIKITATPTAAAAAQGYTEESTSFTVKVNYASEAPTFDTSKVKATFTDAVDSTGAVISGKKTMTVTGLKPNQAYSVVARVAVNGTGNIRAFTTDANGTGTTSWNTTLAHTLCTIAEIDVSDVTDTSASIIRRDYAGTFPFEGVVIPTSGNAWLRATNNNIQLQWDAKPDYTGYYYINGTRANIYTTYTLINVIRNSAPGTYDLVVSTSTDGGETLTEWARLDKALTITDDSYTPELTITGQDNGGYLFTPAGNTNAFYEYVLLTPEGNTIKSWWIGADTAADVAPYDGCTFLVHETAWKATGTKLSSVAVTRSGETELGFTPYDFSSNVVTITADDDEALIAALRTGGKVILESDVTIATNDSRLYRGGDVVLDLNGHNIDVGSTNSWRVESGKHLTITDSTGKGGVYGSAGISIDAFSKLTIEEGAYVQRHY